MHGAEIEGRQYGRPEEAGFCIPEKQSEHKGPEHQLLLESGQDGPVINHGAGQFRIDVSEEGKHEIQRQYTQECDSESLEDVSTQSEKRKQLFRLDYDGCQNQGGKGKEQCLYRQTEDRVARYVEKCGYKADVSPEEDDDHACKDGIEYSCRFSM